MLSAARGSGVVGSGAVVAAGSDSAVNLSVGVFDSGRQAHGVRRSNLEPVCVEYALFWNPKRERIGLHYSVEEKRIVLLIVQLSCR